jgi:hypothetical protein
VRDSKLAGRAAIWRAIGEELVSAIEAAQESATEEARELATARVAREIVPGAEERIE